MVPMTEEEKLKYNRYLILNAIRTGKPVYWSYRGYSYPIHYIEQAQYGGAGPNGWTIITHLGVDNKNRPWTQRWAIGPQAVAKLVAKFV